MTECFTGKCVGGPHDGQMLAHWQKIMKFYRPMIGWAIDLENAPVEAVNIGEYRLNDYGQWHWWETDEGRAFAKLHGPHSRRGSWDQGEAMSVESDGPIPDL